MHLIIKKELLRDEEVDLELYNEYITYNAHLDKLRSQNLLEVSFPFNYNRR